MKKLKLHEKYKNLLTGWLFLILILLSLPGKSQQLPPKEVKEFVQFWTSMNMNARLSDKWSLLADFHARRNDFLKNPGFYLLRAGAAYRIRPNFSVTAGYAHLWLASTYRNKGYYTNENRVYEQAIFTHPAGKINILHRLRNEQRWIENPINDTSSGKYGFTNRIRYLLSLRIPVFKNPKYPQLILADEIMIHFGDAVNYSNFEQNRIFAGINQPISKTVSFDFGYMYIYQLRTSGYQYNSNHTIRLFFYYNPDWRKHSQIKAIDNADD